MEHFADNGQETIRKSHVFNSSPSEILHSSETQYSPCPMSNHIFPVPRRSDEQETEKNRQIAINFHFQSSSPVQAVSQSVRWTIWATSDCPGQVKISSSIFNILPSELLFHLLQNILPFRVLTFDSETESVSLRFFSSSATPPPSTSTVPGLRQFSL